MLKINRNVFSLQLIIAIFIVNNFNATAKEPTPYAFLSNSLSARSAGLAGAVVSFENDAGGFLINPALLATHQGNNFNATFLKHILDINSGNATYIYQASKLGTFAGSVVYTNYGSFDYYDIHGNPTGGSFTGNHISLAGSYAGEIGERLYGGITAKFIFNQLEKMNGFAFAVDAGLLYKLPDERTNFGFSILNAGTEMKKMYDNSARIPMDVRLGFNHRLQGLPLNFNFGFNNLNDTGDFFKRFGNINIGGELYIGEYVQLRVGFDNYVRKNLAASQNKGLTGVSAGAGIITDIINVDYAISIYTSNLFLHRFGINLKL